MRNISPWSNRGATRLAVWHEEADSLISKRSTRKVFQVGSFLRRRAPRPPLFEQQSSDYKPFSVLSAFLSDVCCSLVSRYFCSFRCRNCICPMTHRRFVGTSLIKIYYELVLLYHRRFSVFPGKLAFILHGWGTHERTVFPGFPKISVQFPRFGAKNAPILVTSESKWFFCISSTAWRASMTNR